MLKSYDEMTADQKLAYEMGREAERARRDDPAEIRAAVVPLLELEPADDGKRPRCRIEGSGNCARVDRSNPTCAALGLGEES